MERRARHDDGARPDRRGSRRAQRDVRALGALRTVANGDVAGARDRRLRPDADETLLLAARAHHIRRWTVPRTSYPEGRAGYLKWRRDLHGVHAAEVGRILTDVGYDTATIERVQEIVKKRNLAKDA